MKVFYSNDFRGHWPVGTAAIVVAKDQDEARRLLIIQAKFRGLDLSDDDFTLKELSTDWRGAVILADGNY